MREKPSDDTGAGVPTVRVRLLVYFHINVPQLQFRWKVVVTRKKHKRFSWNLIKMLPCNALLRVEKDRLTHVQVFNPTGSSCRAEAGSGLGEAVPADLIEAEEHPAVELSPASSDYAAVRRITQSQVQVRKKKLCEIVGKPDLLTPQPTKQLHQFLGEHHNAFCLDSNERR